MHTTLRGRLLVVIALCAPAPGVLAADAGEECWKATFTKQLSGPVREQRTSGGTYGYKEWDEVTATDRALFGSQEFFALLKSAELRLHYRVEWSAAGIETSFQNLQHEIGRTHDHYETWPPNSSHSWSSNARRTQTWLKSPVGTIRWIQRLVTEPRFW